MSSTPSEGILLPRDEGDSPTDEISLDSGEDVAAGRSGRSPKKRKRKPGKRPGRFRRWVLRPLGWGLAGLAVLIFVLQLLIDTPWARSYARHLIADAISRYFETDVTIADISFELLPLRVEVWGLHIDGPEGRDAPMLHVPWAAIDGDLAAFEQRQIRMRQIRVERPLVNLQYFADGTSNVIQFRRTGRKRRFEVFIDRLEVDKAEFQTGQERIRLTVHADAVQARMRGMGEMHLKGQLVAQNAVIKLPNAPPFAVSVSAKGGFQRGRADIPEAHISGPLVDLDMSGECEWSRKDRQDRKCRFDVEGTSHGELLARLGYFKDLRGPFGIDGTFSWRPGTTGWRSQVKAAELVAWERRVQDVEGTLSADRYGVRFSLERGRYGGGILTGDVAWDRDEAGLPYDIDLTFRGVKLDELLADQQIPVRGFASRVDGNLSYRYLQGQSGRGDGSSEVRLRSDPELDGLPMQGAFPLRIENGKVRVDSLNLQSADQSTRADGWYDLDAQRGAFEYEIASADLAGLTPLLPLREEDRITPPLWLPVQGEGRLEGTLHLEPDNTWSDAQVRWEKMETPSLTARQVSGNLRFGRQAIERLYLELSDGDQALVMRGRIPFDSTDPEGTVMAFDAVDWPLDEVRPWLTYDVPLGGQISGHLDLHLGIGSSDGRLAATVTPAMLQFDTTSGPVDVQLDGLSGTLRWDAERMLFEEVIAHADSGTVRGSGAYHWDGRLDLDVPEAELEMGAEPLRRFLPRSDLRGRVRVGGEVRGSASSPRLAFHLAADSIALGGRRLVGRSSQLDVRWQERRFEATGQLLDMMKLEGGGHLDAQRVDLTFEVDGNNLEGLAELLFEAPPDVGGRFHGQLELLGATGKAPEVILALDDFEVRLRDHLLEESGPASLHFDPSGIEIRSLTLREPSSDSRFALEGHLAYGEQASLDLGLESTLDTRWLEFFDLGFELDGNLALQGRLGGTYESPRFTGTGELTEGAIPLGTNFPHPLEDLRGRIDFYPESLEFERLEGQLAGGQVVLSGSFELPSAPGSASPMATPTTELELAATRQLLEEAAPPSPAVTLGLPLDLSPFEVGLEPSLPQEDSYSYTLQFEGTDLQMLYPEGWVVAGDASLTLRSTPNGGHVVDGTAHFERMEYLNEIRFDFEQLMRAFLERQRLEVTPTDSLLSSVQLDVAIEGPGALRVQNDLADLDGSVDLLMRGSLASPVLYGELVFDRGGNFSFSGTDYEIERGRVLFTNPYELDPEVDLLATARVRDFDILLAISGTFDRLETRFSSEPPLPDLEVFRLLASGEDAVEDPSALETRPARRVNEDPSTSAATFLYGQAASVIGERVNTLFGFDKFRIDPLTGSGDNLSKARVTVGKRLSKDIFLTFSTAPSANEAQRLQIEWQASPGLKLVLTQNSDDTYSADARWETSF